MKRDIVTTAQCRRARIYGHENNFRGTIGGWIYRVTPEIDSDGTRYYERGARICQGWANFYRRYAHLIEPWHAQRRETAIEALLAGDDETAAERASEVIDGVYLPLNSAEETAFKDAIEAHRAAIDALDAARQALMREAARIREIGRGRLVNRQAFIEASDGLYDVALLMGGAMDEAARHSNRAGGVLNEDRNATAGARDNG